MIEIKNLTYEINGKKILNNINLSVAAGEKIALIGPSGAGKTTLINILCNQTTDYIGQVYVNGRLLQPDFSHRELAFDVGVIRQQLDLVDELSVRNNILAGKLKDWSFVSSLKSLMLNRHKELVVPALKAVNLDSFAKRKTGNLSGGEKQRVAIARLLVQDPRVILGDEPIASLDPSLASKVLELLLNSTHKKTKIISIHNVDYALKYFDRIIAIKAGTIKFDLDINNVSDDMIRDLYDV